MENEDIISRLNIRAKEFEGKHGELMCLRANLAAINIMLIKRKKGEELLQSFNNVIERFENGEV